MKEILINLIEQKYMKIPFFNEIHMISLRINHKY